MPNYGAENLKNFLAALSSSAKQQQEHMGAQDLAKQKQVADLEQLLTGEREKHRLAEEGVAAREKTVTEASTKFPKRGVSASKEGFAITAPPKEEDPERAAARSDRVKKALIDTVKKDYDKLAGTQPKRLLALQAVQKAIDAGDITTVGRIKAQLPILEGENYKPTDKERELMLQNTASSNLERVKNWWGGDNAAIAPAQLDALKRFTQSKLGEEQGLTDRNRREIMARYSNQFSTLDSRGVEDLAATLGMSGDELLLHLDRPENATAGKGKTPISRAKETLGIGGAAPKETPRQKLERLRKGKKGP